MHRAPALPRWKPRTDLVASGLKPGVSAAKRGAAQELVPTGSGGSRDKPSIKNFFLQFSCDSPLQQLKTKPPPYSPTLIREWTSKNTRGGIPLLEPLTFHPASLFPNRSPISFRINNCGKTRVSVGSHLNTKPPRRWGYPFIAPQEDSPYTRKSRPRLICYD